MAYRSRLGFGDSQREISRQTVTDPRTTKHVLAFLAECKLVTCQNEKWFASEPEDNIRKWFAENDKPKYNNHWSDSFCYSSLLIPRQSAKVKEGSHRRFTVNHSHVYSILQSLGRGNKQNPGVVERIGVSRLSKILSGLSVKTIRSSLRLLESIGLVISYQEGQYVTIHVQQITNDHDHLFEKAKQSSCKNKEQKASEQQEVRFQNEDMHSIYKECRREGMPIKLSKDITVAAAMAGVDSMSFDGYSEQATLDHARNRMAGKVSVEHHGHLLLHKLKQGREEQDRAEAKMMTHSSPLQANSSNPIQISDICSHRMQDLTTQSKKAPPAPTSGYLAGLEVEVIQTDEFLCRQFGRRPTMTDLNAAIDDGRIQKWLDFGKVSSHYLAVSPAVKDALGSRSGREVFGSSFDLALPLLDDFTLRERFLDIIDKEGSPEVAVAKN